MEGSSLGRTDPDKALARSVTERIELLEEPMNEHASFPQFRPINSRMSVIPSAHNLGRQRRAKQVPEADRADFPFLSWRYLRKTKYINFRKNWCRRHRHIHLQKL